MNRRPLPFVLLGLLAAGGCRNPSPAVVFHTLSPIPQERTTPAPAEKPLALEIMPVQVPELLQRSQLVVLEEQGRHRLLATHRWGNTLEKDLQRVLIADLSTLLGSEAVVPYPMGDRVKANYRISLDVQQCDGTPGGTLWFRATWMLTLPSDDRMVLLRRFSLQEPVAGGSIEQLVSAHSRVMASLSQEIAATLKALPSR